MSAPRTVSPEMAENAQHRYEKTDEPVAAIAADCGMSERTFYKFIKRRGWRLRIHRPPRDLPAELRLTNNVDRALKEAEALSHSRLAVCDGPESAPQHHSAKTRVNALTVPQCAGDTDGPADVTPDRASIADRLEGEMEAVLAQVERLRAEPWAHPAADAQNLTRILERLTEALIKVRRLRSLDGPAGRADDFDSMPKDIDEFRHALARRIEAFVRSRAGGELPAAGKDRDRD
jgi:hypothetical protein